MEQFIADHKACGEKGVFKAAQSSREGAVV